MPAPELTSTQTSYWWLLGGLGLCAEPLGLGGLPQPEGWNTLRPGLGEWLWSSAALELLGQLLGGRAMLALLPPGAPPERGPGAWLETLAASFWLGALLQGAPAWLGLVLALAVWLWPRLLGPQALRPRHVTPQPEPDSVSQGFTALALLLPLAWTLGSSLQPWERWPWALAVLGSLHFGLRLAHQPPALRAGALALASALLGAGSAALPPAVFLAFLVPWLRRADTRSLWLAAGLLALGEFPWWQQAMAAACALWASAPTVRRRALLALGLGVGLGAARSLLLSPNFPYLPTVEPWSLGLTHAPLLGLMGVMALIAAGRGQATLAQLSPAARRVARAPQLLALLLLLLLAVALCFPQSRAAALSSNPALSVILLAAWCQPSSRGLGVAAVPQP